MRLVPTAGSHIITSMKRIHSDIEKSWNVTARETTKIADVQGSPGGKPSKNEDGSKKKPKDIARSSSKKQSATTWSTRTRSKLRQISWTWWEGMPLWSKNSKQITPSTSESTNKQFRRLRSSKRKLRLSSSPNNKQQEKPARRGNRNLNWWKTNASHRKLRRKRSRNSLISAAKVFSREMQPTRRQRLSSRSSKWSKRKTKQSRKLISRRWMTRLSGIMTRWQWHRARLHLMFLFLMTDRSVWPH